MIRGLFLGAFLVTGVALYTWSGRSIVGSRVESNRLPVSIESAELEMDDGGRVLNVTVRNNELHHLIAAVDCEPGQEGDPSPCAATTTSLLSPGGRATIHLSLTSDSIPLDVVDVRVRERIAHVDPGPTSYSRISPTHHRRVDLK